MFSNYARALGPFSIFGDSRINALFPKMVEQIGSHFGCSIPQSANDNAQMQSFYRFFFKSLC